jgi:hypothetical protein
VGLPTIWASEEWTDGRRRSKYQEVVIHTSPSRGVVFVIDMDVDFCTLYVNR